MARTLISALTFCALLLHAAPASTATFRHPGSEQQAGQDDMQRARSVLQKIEAAIATRDVQTLSQFFTSKVYLTLFTGENGYYSSEQSFFILRNFFASYAPLNLTLSLSGTSAGTPYGVGQMMYVFRGRRGNAQVFVALVRSEKDFKLNQITIAQR